MITNEGSLPFYSQILAIVHYYFINFFLFLLQCDTHFSSFSFFFFFFLFCLISFYFCSGHYLVPHRLSLFDILLLRDQTENQLISRPSFLLRHCHVAYVFARPQEDILQINLSTLIGLVKTYARFSLVCIFHYFSNKVILYLYVLCSGMKGRIPCNMKSILTVTKHINFLLFVSRLLQ